MTTDNNSARQFLRHTIATLAYRGGKALRGAPESFAAFDPGQSGKTAVHVVAHMGDLFDWALTMVKGKQEWHNSTPLPWAQEVERFFKTLQVFDDYLASDAPLALTEDKLFQGPIADALTHVGQLAMLRRLAGCPIKTENYARAAVVAGKVGMDQTPPAKEF
jgi:hypothetical protein